MPLSRLLAIAAVAALAACGGGRDADREPPPPEETVFGTLVESPGKVQDRLDAANQGHREALEQQLEASEGAADVEE